MEASVARVVLSSSAAALGTRRLRGRLHLLPRFPSPSPRRALNPKPASPFPQNCIHSFTPSGSSSRPFSSSASSAPFGNLSSSIHNPFASFHSHSDGAFAPITGDDGLSASNGEGDEALLERGNVGINNGEERAVWTAVLLGWLGAEHRHLKRYADLYRSKGIRVVTFVTPPGQLLGVDLGRRVERRIAGFTAELVSQLSEEEEKGNRSFLLFHTFSNTGWLTYGAILDNLHSRGDIVQKIKGCVVDSGADAEINPQVWAAGFCAAFLKRRSSLTYSSRESTKGDKLDSNFNSREVPDVSPPMAELLLLGVLEKFFTFILGLPDVNRRLRKIISTLSTEQPLCPQLYLYSSADKVIPFRSVELFVEGQKASGRTVYTHDFVSSPHVDHLRSFPDVYSAEVTKFLDERVIHSSNLLMAEKVIN